MARQDHLREWAIHMLALAAKTEDQQFAEWLSIRAKQYLREAEALEALTKDAPLNPDCSLKSSAAMSTIKTTKNNPRPTYLRQDHPFTDTPVLRHHCYVVLPVPCKRKAKAVPPLSEAVSSSYAALLRRVFAVRDSELSLSKGNGAVRLGNSTS
jgi:hypothetical protein